MTGPEIIAKVQALHWPEGSYIVFGSCPMALAGLRTAHDIDFLVKPSLFARLKEQGWQPLVKNANDVPLVKGDYEAHDIWNFSSYQPTLAHLLSTATVVGEVPFAALSEVRKWKASSARPKDLTDINMIDEYLSQQTK